MLTALTENFTSVDGARSSNTYINSVVFSIVEFPSLVNWIIYCTTTPLSLDDAVHEKVMLVKVVTAMSITTFSGGAIRETNLVHAWLAQQHQALPLPLVIAANGGENSPMPASFSAAIMSV